MDLVTGIANYNLFLRFFELYWVGPLVQHRPVYATPLNLWIDFWGCLRTFPKPAKEDTKELKKGEVKQFTKDKVNFVTHKRLLSLRKIDCSKLYFFYRNSTIFLSIWLSI